MDKNTVCTVSICMHGIAIPSLSKSITNPPCSSQKRFYGRGYLHGFAKPNGDLVLVGGTDLVETFNDTWLSSDGGKSWTCQRRNEALRSGLFSSSSGSSTMWCGRYGSWFATNATKSIVVVGGGASLSGSCFSDAYVSFDWGLTWVRLTKKMWKRGIVHAQAAICGATLFVIGGTPFSTCHDGSMFTSDTSAGLNQYFSATIPDGGAMKGATSFNRVVGDQWGRYEGAALNRSESEVILINGLSRGEEEIEESKGVDYDDDNDDECRAVAVYRMNNS